MKNHNHKKSTTWTNVFSVGFSSNYEILAKIDANFKVPAIPSKSYLLYFGFSVGFSSNFQLIFLSADTTIEQKCG